ncbi:TetR/AcrR family transcriptional regulator [Gordonia lacunae]|uniref:TetR family transcriptional regulator n=1 Tax=Gordonia lacunae TaxID=417102 RepID=A0A243Q4K9_9ACTN|nr:TetR/AcrR family transcriptional regulator [Gordonia lacunae]OUC76306.1 TetR family transcriptional regulator [Gordonia lacunae]
MSDASSRPVVPQAGVARPGGRTAAVRGSVLSATEDALIEHGFAGIDLSSLARAAGVGKTTIYRRWGTPQCVVADLLDDMAARSVTATRTGNLDADLRANAELVVRTLTHPRQGRLFAALIAASTHDRDTKAALAEFFRRRVEEWSLPIIDAIERGEVPPNTDPIAVVRHLSAPLYYQFLTMTTPLDDLAADRAARATVAAMRAQCFAKSDAAS